MVSTWPAVLATAFVGGLVYALTLLFVSFFDSYKLFRLLRPDVLHVLKQKISSQPDSELRSVANALCSEAAQTE